MKSDSFFSVKHFSKFDYKMKQNSFFNKTKPRINQMNRGSKVEDPEYGCLKPVSGVARPLPSVNVFSWRLPRMCPWGFVTPEWHARKQARCDCRTMEPLLEHRFTPSIPTVPRAPELAHSTVLLQCNIYGAVPSNSRLTGATFPRRDAFGHHGVRQGPSPAFLPETMRK